MATANVTPIYDVFHDSDGTPLENGYVYIGVSGKNPLVLANQLAIYWDEAATIPAAQPIRTIGGFPSRNGSPGNIYVKTGHSIIVQDKNQSLVWSELSATGDFGRAVTPQDFGAVGDGVTDDTAAIQAAIDYAVNNDRGVDIIFPHGIYLITSSLTADPSGSDERRNISFIGQGGSNTIDHGVILKYQGTDADGMFDLDAVRHFHFEKIAFLNDAETINQLLKIHASSATTNSVSFITFEKCYFQNTLETAKELANGHVWAYNSLNVTFRDCRFSGSPNNVTLGIDPSLTTGVAGGFVGRINFDSTYFTGDVNITRAAEVNWSNGCIFAEKWSNAGSPTESARIYVPDETYTNVLNLNISETQFEGLSSPTTFTAGAIVLSDGVKAVTVYGNTFRPGYSKGIVVNNDCDAIDVRANYVDMDAAGSSVFIDIGSGFTGRVTESNDHLTTTMIADSGVLFADARSTPYSWPHVVKLPLGSDYVMVAGDTWEKVLTTASITWPAGMYKVEAKALFLAGATHAVQMKVTNTDGYTSGTQSEIVMASGFRDTLSLTDYVYLAEPVAGRTFSLEVRESVSQTGTVKYLNNAGGSVTYLRVTPM